ncbi:winged helix DNA-binding domain-containing protein [Listeria costaricensis]|uniref:winged helix DNA-binding domain-containing protein n=1 Tax=Listeria costaricensis TaxID=2026604 RepID=UPI0013C5221F|nr:winged helix DNA-binding domain-containing protein [Listeria costaricensis]
MQKLTDEAIRHARFYNSGLYEPFLSCQEAASRLFGIQAQYQQFADINLYNRVDGLDKERLTDLYQQSGLIKLWGQRMTVHLYESADWGILQALYQERHNWVKKQFAERELDLDILLAEMEELLLTKGQVDKGEIAALLGENSKELMTWGGILIQATLDGLLYCVPETPKTRLYRHNRLLEATPAQYDKDAAVIEMLRRYFCAYGPASLRDFRHWSGLKAADFMPFINEALADFTVVSDERGSVVYYHPDYFFPEVRKGIMMLGKFDPLFVCYADKRWIAAEDEISLIWRKAGQIESVLLIDGKLRGTWRYQIQGGKVQFRLFPNRKISKPDLKRIEVKCQELAQFMGKELQGIIME